MSTLAPDVFAALAVRVKQTDRIEGGAAGAGGVLLPLAPGVSTALTVRDKLLD
ncbi:hypothetical protein [Sansalvadorimonas verongulae]|uniref:hypothetical protein n=1 Tax=Sansalvadorimonas verongulae TaxID=2172824 RepID=UPI0012BD0168|nr:hypothetical protein [Sansalvadorimonas verongulae]